MQCGDGVECANHQPFLFIFIYTAYKEGRLSATWEGKVKTRQLYVMEARSLLAAAAAFPARCDSPTSGDRRHGDLPTIGFRPRRE